MKNRIITKSIVILVLIAMLSSISFNTVFALDRIEPQMLNNENYSNNIIKAKPKISIHARSYNKVEIKWEHLEDAEQYEVYRSTSAGGHYEKLYTTLENYCIDTNIKYGKNYYYKVRAFLNNDEEKEYSRYSDIVHFKAKLNAPTGVKAASISYKKIKISWNPVVGADGYKIYRATSKTGEFELLKTTKATSYRNTGLKYGKTYRYKIKAYKKISGKIKYSKATAVVSAKTRIGKATGLTAEVVDYGKVRLRWTGREDIDEYDIYRSTSKKGEYVFIESVINENTFIDDDVDMTDKYFYKIRAVACVNGRYSWSKSEGYSKILSVDLPKFKVDFNSKYVENCIRKMIKKPTGDIVFEDIPKEIDGTYAWPCELTDEEVKLVYKDIEKFDFCISKFAQDMYIDDIEDYMEEIKVTDEKIRQIKYGVDFEHISDYDKVKYIHDYLIDNMVYDYSKNHSFHVYDALINGGGVCHDYAYAFLVLAKELGLDAEYVSNNIHAWNLVKIDGQYYNVDCTWDDSNSKKYRYTLFLVSDETIKCRDTAKKEHDNRTLQDIICPEDYNKNWEEKS